MPPSKTTVSAVAIAEAARRTQLILRREVVRDVSRTWAVLDFDRLKATWPAWLTVMTSILSKYHAQSADDAALFYRATRQLEVGDPGVASLASPPTEEWVSKALGYSAPGVFDKQSRSGVDPVQARRSALTQTLGTSTRIVLDGSRTTVVESVQADPVALGFYRVTDGDPCAFCALMASRGMVYKTAESAGDILKWHNDCGCTVAPGFKRGMVVTGVAKEAADVYASRGEGDALKAFRKAWNSRHVS